MSCARQLTVAIIVNKGKFWVGSNSCDNPQKRCPRGNMPTGIGYELCKDICKQTGHAEENACRAAGKSAKGGTLYLIGHTYCCHKCMKIIKRSGIIKVVILS